MWQWLGWGFGTLCLAQLAPFTWLNPGYILGATLCVAGAFPAAALAGLGLDLAGITAVPMTAVKALAEFMKDYEVKNRV